MKPDPQQHMKKGACNALLHHLLEDRANKFIQEESLNKLFTYALYYAMPSFARQRDAWPTTTPPVAAGLHHYLKIFSPMAWPLYRLEAMLKTLWVMKVSRIQHAHWVIRLVACSKPADQLDARVRTVATNLPKPMAYSGLAARCGRNNGINRIGRWDPAPGASSWGHQSGQASG